MPWTPVDTVIGAPSSAGSPAAVKPDKVLFVDDDPLILDAVTHSLKGRPYDLLLAGSGHQALEMLARQAVQVVVTDIVMPQMDGIALLETVAQRYPETIRFVLSGRSNTRTIIDAMKAGSIYRYLLKPWDPEELHLTIEQALSLWHLHDERAQMITLLRQHNEALESVAAWRAQQLLAFERQADIGRRAAQIVHNLSTPLQTLTAVIDMLALYNDCPPDPPKVSRILSLARKAARDLKSIVTGILLHARQEQQSAPCPIDINQLIEEQMGFFEIVPEFKYKTQKELVLEPALPRIVGSPIELKQILSNLIKNAIDAMANVENKCLHVQTVAADNRVGIIISDNGEGIRASDRERIFSPDFTTKPAGQGTGLGLASVKTMVEAYGGQIQFESAVGKGTSFRVDLPVRLPGGPVGPAVGTQADGVDGLTRRLSH